MQGVRGVLVVLLAVPALAGCRAAEPAKSPPSGVDELVIPTPSPDPADFVDRIDNPWLPLTPGSEWVYETTGGDPQRITVTVTDQTREVAGVTATVVHDVVRAPDGTLLEDTYDWFAQDVDGNVWYLGEDTTEYDEQGRPDTEGSWEAGVDGAEAGLAMAARPRVGDSYEQEQLAGVAEDRAEVLSLDEQRSVPAGEYDDLLQTEETTPLEPDVVEHKYYARGVGTVLEETVAGGAERVELVSFTAG
ncbi:hypothetical protein [Nocardioides taihuensis]|uniref:DUF3068 domain-containing protein n=1 Tax=Nocardioides taihuensis TaxID=1835606 RepID=A0ABW0BFL5_9ACTN